jgi:hypothetical protein
MESQTTAAAIDDFEEELIQMNMTGSTQEELLTWLNTRGVTVSRRTLARRLKLWQEESPSSDSEQLINLIDHLFHTQPTYSDGLISRRLKEDYNLQVTARHVKTIRLRNSWLRRNNDLEASQAQQAETTHLIHELLQEGQIRQYGRRYLITRLARQYGHRAQDRHVRQALQILDNHNMTQRTPGMRRKRQENYIVPGPDWLWCLDGHDKLARYGIEIYGSVDAYSRKIIWFYVGVSNRTQVSVLHQYLHTIKTLGYCPNYLRTDRGRETPMMADAHYYLYHTACLHDDTISDEAFDNICFADCYLFGKSTGNVKIEGLWGQLIIGQTEQWMLYFPKLEAEGWWRDDLVCDTVILIYIFIPIIRGEIFNWVTDKNRAPIRPQRHRSQHVSGIPNDLYRGSDDAPRQGFSFDLNLFAQLEANVAGFGKPHHTSFIIT